jgi:gamma-glutamyl:cysteine ligase YbdK (ATP-grasp superfamily)
VSGDVLAELRPLGLFEGYGVEIEYAIVDRESLAVRPLADRLIEAEHGDVENEIERGPMAWSNELALHVIELKTNGPVARLEGLDEVFQAEIVHVDALLARMGARLMPTGMHPFMDPERDFALWPHGDRAIYETFHRIFDCRGHGWSNLQSMHLNLPFEGDAQFRRLHDAVRLLLPLLPALAASSPLREGRATGSLDTRLEVYRTNAARVPSVSGAVVPERALDRAGYEREILGRIYADLAPLDPEGVLRHEWVNARGAIARFDRGALEIRVLDTQECPRADLAVAAATAGVLRGLVEAEAGAGGEGPPLQRLAALLGETARRGGEAEVDDAGLLRALGLPERARPAHEVWRELVARHVAPTPGFETWREALETILGEGCLARRILRRLGGDLRPEAVRAVYAELCECLRRGRLFRAGR